MLIKAKAGPESEQYGLFEEASASLVYFQFEVGFYTANLAVYNAAFHCTDSAFANCGLLRSPYNNGLQFNGRIFQDNERNFCLWTLLMGWCLGLSRTCKLAAPQLDHGARPLLPGG